jgi:hypothetical protein
MDALPAAPQRDLAQRVLLVADITQDLTVVATVLSGPIGSNSHWDQWFEPQSEIR